MTDLESRPAESTQEAPVADRSLLSALASDANQILTGVAIGVGSGVGTAVAVARILKGGDTPPPSDGAGGGGASEPAPGAD